MNPGSKGWLKEYLDYRQESLMSLTGEGRKAAHPDYSVYRAVQPGGLMYGQPIHLFDHPDALHWNEKDLMKVLLADSMISSTLLFHEKFIKDPAEMSTLTEKTLESMANYYNHVFPELGISTKTIFGKKKSALEQVERILDKRVGNTVEFKGSFWTKLFHNSLLFLDVFIFGQWIHTNADKIVSDFFKYEREELRTSVVKVMAAAAHANHIVEFEERKLLEAFLQSAQLSPDKRKECQEIFEQGISTEEINLPTNNSWLLKKYFLEIAILTVWSDKKVEESELEFIRRFARTLSFSDEDMEQSMIAVEGFVLEYWNELTKLQDKKSYEEVKVEFMKRLSRVTEKNKSRLVKEVKTKEELIQLLQEARKNEIGDGEKQRLKELLTEVLKSIPAFSIISLPTHFLTLPVLMQVFPKDFIIESLSKN